MESAVKQSFVLFGYKSPVTGASQLPSHQGIMSHREGHTGLVGEWINWKYVSEDEDGEDIDGIRIEMSEGSQTVWTKYQSDKFCRAAVSREVQSQQTGGQRIHTEEGQCSCRVSKPEPTGTSTWDRH